MKQQLLCGLVACAAVSAMAVSPALPQAHRAVSTTKSVNLTPRHVVSSKQLAKDVRLNVMQDAAGRRYKQLDAPGAMQRIAPGKYAAMPKAGATHGLRAAANPDMPLSEDFEGWDGVNRAWLPEGWSTPSFSAPDTDCHWGISKPADYQGMLGGVTGYNLSINYSSEYLDERIVLPPVTLGEDMSLQLDILNDGLWYFSTDNVDWDTYEYIGDKVLMLDQKILVSTDNGQTFDTIKSFAEDFAHLDFMSLLMEGTNALRHESVSLADYAGKTVVLAIQYVGIDGNLGAVDNIVIGKPALDVSYANPMGTLYYGLSRESIGLNYSILLTPVYADLDFANTTFVDGTYTWDYMDNTSQWAVGTDPDQLTVSYTPDHTSADSQRNNLFYTPVLNGVAEGFSEGSFTRCDFLQAGGKNEFEISYSDGSKQLVDFGASVVDGAYEGVTTATDALVPVFGYSPNSDQYWTDYTFQGDEGEGDYAHLTHYMNYFLTGTAPMVINGLWAQGLGVVSPAATFTAEVVALDDEGAPAQVLASATATGDAIDQLDLDGSDSKWITLNFSFDKPLVISADVCQAYVVRIGGFRDAENVEYFAPLMSDTDNIDGYALGWIQKEMSYEGEVNRSLSPVFYYTEGLQAFFINLDAEYPWLLGEETKQVSAGSHAVALDSYHHGQKLSVAICPDWLTATFDGRYNQAVLNLDVAETAPLGTTEITIVGPGVSHTIALEIKPSGIESITADALGHDVRLFNLQGVAVSRADATPGLYIARDAAGNARKIALQ